MPSTERLHHKNEELLFAQDIADAIPHDLTPSGYPEDFTKKYFIPQHPELVVRRNESSPKLEDIRKASSVFRELPQYGIDVLPHTIIEHQNTAYTVTFKVEGDPLEAIIESDPDREVIETIDTTWSNLAIYARICKITDSHCAKDIFTPDQYMLGTIAGEEAPRLWLVDIGQYAVRFSENEGFDTYRSVLTHLSFYLSLIEDKIAQPLPRSRESLEQALELLDDYQPTWKS